MKLRIPEIIMGALLTIAIFAAGMIFSSVNFPKADPSSTVFSWLVRDAAGFFAFCAVVVASVQAVFFWYQLRIMRSSMIDARTAAEAGRTSADAAALSARAAVALQLPVIRIEPDLLSHGDGTADGEPYENCTVHSVKLSNLGATKAFPKEIAYGWTIGDELPAEPNYRYIDSFLPNLILEPDPKITPRKRLQGEMPLEPEQWPNICKGNYLWFYCSLLYDDFMSEPRSQGFCWRWVDTGKGLGWRAEKNALAYNKKV